MELEEDIRLLTSSLQKFKISSILSFERIIQISIILSVLGAWEAAGSMGLLYGLVPTFSATIQAAWMLLSTGKIWPDIMTSSYEIGVAMLIAVVCGIGTGLVLSPIEYIRKLFEPLIVYLGSIPKIILFPIALLFLSVGPGSKIALGAVSGFVPVLMNVMVGFREVDDKYVRMAKSKGASRFQLYRKIYFPAMIYPIFAGIRLGMGVAITGTLLGETKVANRGLGFLADHYYGQFGVAEMYAVLLIIFIGAAVINLMMTALLAKLTKFKASEVEERRCII